MGLGTPRAEKFQILFTGSQVLSLSWLIRLEAGQQ